MSFIIGIDLVANTDNATAEIGNVQSSLLDLERSQDNFAASTDKATEAAGKQKGAFDELSGKVTGLVAGYLSIKGIELAGSIIHDGEAALVTTARFEGLAAQYGDTANLMQQLETVTGNATTQQELMTGTSRLMSLSLADSKTQLLDIVQTADFLGDAMGKTGDHISDFSDMLANHSTRALRDWGLNAQSVTDTMKTLKETMPNASEQELFKLAVLDEAKKHTQDFAAAAALADDPLSKFETRMGNILDKAKEWAATGFNTITTTLDQMGQIANATSTNGNQVVGAVASEMASQLSQAGMITQQQAEIMRQGAQIIADTHSTLGQQYAINETNANLNPTAQQAELDRLNAAQAAMWADVGRQHSESYWKSFTDYYQRPTSMVDFANAFNAAHPGMAQAVGQQIRDQIEQQAILQDAASQSLSSVMQDMTQFTSQGAIGEFLDPARAQGYADELTKVTSEFEYLQSLHEAGLISDSDLNNAQTMRDKVAGLADEAQRAAQNFQNMTLSTAFGQGGGGMMGQMSDAVIASMQKAGKSPEEIAAAQRAFGLASGRETGASAAFSDIIVPELAKMNPADAAKAMENLTAFLQAANVKGLTPDQIATMLPGATGFMGGGTGAGFTVRPGDTAGALAARYGVSVNDILSAAGASNQYNLQPGSYNLGGGMTPVAGFTPGGYLQNQMGGFGFSNLPGGGIGYGGAQGAPPGEDTSTMTQNLQDMVTPASQVSSSFSEIKSSSGQIVSDVEAVGQSLTDLTKQKHVVAVELQVTASGALAAILAGGSIIGGTPGTTPAVTNSGVSTVVRNSGGAAPGRDSRIP